ncbi:MAG: hypothetical protein AAB794_02715 [Patescibacteria group bacterium]
MSHKRLWAASMIIACVVLIGFVLSVPHTRDVDIATVIESAPAPVPGVVLRDSFKKGLHTITGSVETPNACTAVTAQASTNADTITVAISIPEDSGICLQVPTQANFTVTVSAPTNLPITAMINGAVATTTVL